MSIERFIENVNVHTSIRIALTLKVWLSDRLSYVLEYLFSNAKNKQNNNPYRCEKRCM